MSGFWLMPFRTPVGMISGLSSHLSKQIQCNQRWVAESVDKINGSPTLAICICLFLFYYSSMLHSSFAACCTRARYLLKAIWLFLFVCRHQSVCSCSRCRVGKVYRNLVTDYLTLVCQGRLIPTNNLNLSKYYSKYIHTGIDWCLYCQSCQVLFVCVSVLRKIFRNQPVIIQPLSCPGFLISD